MSHHPHHGATIYNKNLKAQAVPTGNSRDTDARALSACAKRLDDARKLMTENPKAKRHLEALGDALNRNQQLWTIFQTSLCDQANPLPQNLKATLLNLSYYIDKTSFSLASRYDPKLLDSLIDINRMIATGLSKKPPDEAYMPPPDTRNIPTSLMTSA
jgi:flagellar protein FlaF